MRRPIKFREHFVVYSQFLDLGWTTVKFLGSAFLEIIRVIIPFNGSFLELTANIGDLICVFIRLSNNLVYLRLE